MIVHSTEKEYQALFGCSNCGFRMWEWVKRGVELKQMLASDCPRCGCERYLPVWGQPT